MRRYRSFLTFLAVLAVISLCGCRRTKPSVADPTQPHPGMETQQEESETVKPSDPLPETIDAFPTKESEEETTAVEAPVVAEDGDIRAIIATDIHYLSRDLMDGGMRFTQMVDGGDGKVVTYIEQVTDAFLEEVIARRPDVLILSGDLTLDGEKKSHEELAEKLMTVKEAGIPVLVIPGNHDINNRQAARYSGAERLPAEYTTPAEFAEIYAEFGYREAIAQDNASLSYVYELNDMTRLLMLDSCQYEPRARVGGAISAATYDWIDDQLEAAWEDSFNVIPVAHHNLLDESEIYVDDCTIEHGEQLVEMLEGWDVTLFLSGHLHVQHTKRSDEDRGIWEMVTGSLATPECRYGELVFRGDRSFSYRTRTVDVEGWARRRNRPERDLAAFNTFKGPFLRRVFYNQAYNALKDAEEVTEQQREQMAEFYSELNDYYYQGTAFRIREKALKDPAYELWMSEGAYTVLSDYVQYILDDAVRDYNRVEGE